MPSALKRPCGFAGCSARVGGRYCDKHSAQVEIVAPLGLKKFRGLLTIVCGPPASGKTTYCKSRAAPRDVVIDLDEIKSQLAGAPIHRASDFWFEPAMRERNSRLLRLADKSDGATWFIVGAPAAKERQWWADSLGADSVVVLETSPEECTRRSASDVNRDPSDKDYARIVARWWDRYTRRPGDLIVSEK